MKIRMMMMMMKGELQMIVSQKSVLEGEILQGKKCKAGEGIVEESTTMNEARASDSCLREGEGNVFEA